MPGRFIDVQVGQAAAKDPALARRSARLYAVEVFEKLWRFRRVGHRITDDRTRRSRRVGWDFMHVCIDDHSRSAYVERLCDERAEPARTRA